MTRPAAPGDYSVLSGSSTRAAREAEHLTFDWIIPDKLGACSMPGLWQWVEDDLEFLRGEGVRVLVSLSIPPPDIDLVHKHGMSHAVLPFRDMCAPPPEMIDRFVDIVSKSLDAGEPVAVHCHAGLGRTGTMLACFLVHQGRSADAAIAEVRRQRPGSVETAEQEQAVLDYERRLRG